MRLYEIVHITEDRPQSNLGAELIFKRHICCLTGEKQMPSRQPDDWDGVKRITENLFYAWDFGAETEGSVYLGEFV